MIRLAVFATIFFCGCQSKSKLQPTPTFACPVSPKPTHTIKIIGSFGPRALNIAPPDSQKTWFDIPNPTLVDLNADRVDFVCTALIQRGYQHGNGKPILSVHLGATNDGLAVRYELDGKQETRRVPPAASIEELRTNVEHTLGSLIPRNQKH